jgi:nucleotide-binding universal stress UspA family protein
MSTIVVGLDGSPYSERSLLAAVPLAERLGARLFLFSAVTSEDEANERLDRLSALRPRRVPTDMDVLPDPDPADAIELLLRDLGDAVACIASHGRGRSATLFGSVAAELLSRNRHPIIIVGPGFMRERVGNGVVACVDEHPASAQILPIALHWSEMLGDSLTAITVAEPVLPPLTPGAAPHRTFGPDGNVEQFVEEVVAPLRTRASRIDARAVYDPISPASGLRHYLRDHPAALVAVGGRLRHGFKRSALGSISAAMIRQSFAPTLVVPRTGPA